jgi:hypothetical protein
VDDIATWVFANGGSIGFAGLITLAIMLILTGRLIPRSTVEASRADWHDRLEAKEVQVQDWKQAYFRSLDTQAVQGEQIRELLELSKTTAYFIQALATQAKTEKAP